MEAQAGVRPIVRLNQPLKRSTRLDVLSILRRLTEPDVFDRRKLSYESPFLLGNTTLEVEPAGSPLLLKGKEDVIQDRLAKDDDDSAPTTWNVFAG